MGVRVLGEEHAGIELQLRIDEALDRPHDLVQLVSVLAADIRRHDPAGAVLGLQGPARRQDDVDHVLGEGLVARQAARVVEPLVDQEVDVAVLGVAEDDAVGVAVALEQPDEPGAGLAQQVDGDGDILEQRGRARRAGSGDGGVEALADVPQAGAGGGVGRQRAGRGERQRAEHRGRLSEPVRELVGGGALELDEQGGVLDDVEGAQLVRRLRVALCHPQARRVEQLHRGESRVDERPQRRRRVCEAREDQQPGRALRQHGQSVEGGLRDECEGALRPDHEVLQDVERVVVVEEGVQAVAHRVLDRVQPGERRHRVGVRPHPVAQPEQPVVDLGFLGTQPLRRIRGARVDHGSRRQHQHRRRQGAIGVGVGAARHARRVVGHDAADRAGDLGSGIRAELAPEAREPCVDRPDGRSRLRTHRPALVADRHTPERAARVDQDSGRPGLTRQARAAGTEGHRNPVLPSRGEDARDLGDVGGDRDRAGRQDVVGGVVRAGQPIDRACPHICAGLAERGRERGRRDRGRPAGAGHVVPSDKWNLHLTVGTRL